MDPIAVITLLNAIAELTPKVFALATAAQATMSATDAASVNAALASAQAAATGDLSAALTDLYNAAKQ